MPEQELNKKLAEWAGFIQMRLNDRPHEPTLLYKFPRDSKVGVSLLPDFTQSLDACFKWLVPKLKDIYSLFLEYDAMCDDFKCYLGEVDDEGETIIGETEYGLCLLALPLCVFAKTPALALCKAIEKLIDGEKGENNARERT